MRTHDRECALRTVKISRPERVIQDSGTCMTVATFNCRSARSKEDHICEAVIDQDFDVLALTETWLNDEAPWCLGLEVALAEVWPSFTRKA